MRKFLLATIITLNSLYALAKPEGKVSLKVTDQQQKPLDGVFVQLMRAKDSSMVQYTVSAADGSVQFDNIKYGSYFIYISQTGYEKYFSPSFTIDETHLSPDMASISLQAQTLETVTVVSKVPVIEHYADKTVVNVQSSPLNAGGSAFDVIQRAPGVLVDQNDNISMQGKQGILVMIDGRITPMTGTELANLLRSMPAESIDKIEFITNPSAKYDANGSAGIINIILKKDKRLGANATVNLAYRQGIYPKTNDGFSFNDRTKKFNFFGSYNYFYRGWTNIIDFNTKFYNGSQFLSSTRQHENLLTPSIDQNARLGADFFATDKTTIGIIADGAINKFLPSETTTTYEYDSLNNVKSYNTTSSNSPSTTTNFAVNLNMKHRFDSAGRELLVNADYAPYTTSSYENISTNYYDTYSNPTGTSNLYGYLPRQLNIYSIKADYDGKLGKKGILGAGAKSSYVKTDNDVHIYDGTNSSAPIDTGQSNHFIYSENINAAYVTYGTDWGKANLQVGLRAEQTITHGNQLTTGQTFSHNFIQLFPNFGITDSLGKNNQLGLSISRRIDRPTYDQLNPFSLYINPTFYLNGNPYLVPQNSYVVQLSDAIKQQYFATLSYTHTQYPITTVIEPYTGKPNIVKQTEENLNSSDNYTLEITAAKEITQWWTTTTTADVIESHYTADIGNSLLSTNRLLWTANTDNNFTITKNISLDLNAYYYSGADLGYLYLAPQSCVSVGIQVKILKGKGNVKVNANDIFLQQLTNGTTTFTGFNQTVFVRRDTRMVGIAFSYHIGGGSQSSLRSKGGAEEEKERANTKAG